MGRTALAILNCSAAADDAVQDVLARLWQRGWLPEEPRRALCHLVRMASLHSLRTSRRRCHHEACARVDEEACLFDDPVEQLERREARASVAAALDGLRPDHREVLRLHVFEGHPYTEVADRLGVAVGTVRSRLHRARGALRDVLETGMEDVA